MIYSGPRFRYHTSYRDGRTDFPELHQQEMQLCSAPRNLLCKTAATAGAYRLVPAGQDRKGVRGPTGAEDGLEGDWTLELRTWTSVAIGRLETAVLCLPGGSVHGAQG